MKDIIEFKEVNCKSCYKCIRHCEVKAIRFAEDQAYIIEEKCVLCGRCTTICPQKAKQTVSELSWIRVLIEKGLTVSASLAPSYVAAFPDASFSQVSAALKKLGFARVEETAMGATEVTKAYGELIREKKMKNIITTCCPTTVLLVERFYPKLVPLLAPVVSPAVAHGRMMKQAYGEDQLVIFIGPCISKKYEGQYVEGFDGVLLFDELKQWMVEEGITLSVEDPAATAMTKTTARLYPVAGGIIKTIPVEERINYSFVAVHGLERCLEVLDSLEADQIEGYFIEMGSCGSSCIEGPGMQHAKASFLTTRQLLNRNAKAGAENAPPRSEEIPVHLKENYEPRWQENPQPDEAALADILVSIGKVSEKDMLNCGTCGYSTCMEKAIAVYQGKADLQMCLPYMREKAESMANIVLENTPNAILVLDKDFLILETNRAARKLFVLPRQEITGYPIDIFLDSPIFDELKINRGAMYDVRCNGRDGESVFEINVIPGPQQSYIIIAKDVTRQEESKRELEKIRNETVEIAQKVIDKQMRVAQEIASLLGETTGETKVALTKLKKIMVQGRNL